MHAGVAVLCCSGAKGALLVYSAYVCPSVLYLYSVYIKSRRKWRASASVRVILMQSLSSCYLTLHRCVALKARKCGAAKGGVKLVARPDRAAACPTAVHARFWACSARDAWPQAQQRTRRLASGSEPSGSEYLRVDGFELLVR